MNDGNCFVFSTIFPRDGDVPEDACALRSPPEVTLDGVALELISHAFDGKDLYFEVDMPSALVNAGVVPGSYADAARDDVARVPEGRLRRVRPRWPAATRAVSAAA